MPATIFNDNLKFYNYLGRQPSASFYSRDLLEYQVVTFYKIWILCLLNLNVTISQTT